MNFLFVLGYANPFSGAAWSRVGFFAKDWSNKGHKIDVIGSFSYASFNKKGKKKIDKVDLFNVIPIIMINHPLFFTFNTLNTFFIMLFLLLTKKHDVVVVSFPRGDVGLGALMALNIIKTRYIVDYRDEWENYTIRNSTSKFSKYFFRYVKIMLNHLYKKSQLVLSVTPNFVINLKKRQIKNVMLAPNGAEVVFFNKYNKVSMRKKWDLPLYDFLIIYCGWIGGYYYFENIIKALNELQYEKLEVKLIMIGDGPYLQRIITLSEKFNLQNNVIPLGVIQHKTDIAEILSAGDVGYIPGLYAKGQMPVKFYEYGACGLPTLASVPLNSLLAKLIKKYGVGLIEPSMNHQKLAELIIFFSENEYFTKKSGERAKFLIKSKFNRKKISGALLCLLIDLLEEE